MRNNYDEIMINTLEFKLDALDGQVTSKSGISFCFNLMQAWNNSKASSSQFYDGQIKSFWVYTKTIPLCIYPDEKEAEGTNKIKDTEITPGWN